MKIEDNEQHIDDNEQHIDIDVLMSYLKREREEDQEDIELRKWHEKYDIVMEKFFGYKIDNCSNDDELSYILYTELLDKRKNSRKKYFSKIQKFFPDICKQVLKYYENGSLYDTEYCKIGE